MIDETIKRWTIKMDLIPWRDGEPASLEAEEIPCTPRTCIPACMIDELKGKERERRRTMNKNTQAWNNIQRGVSPIFSSLVINYIVYLYR